jgi:anti-sigma regulatory factor (Ser/Thr protein kinase)
MSCGPVGHKIARAGHDQDRGARVLTEESRFTLSVEAKASELARIRRAVAELAREVGADEEAVARIAIAVGEACSNVVSHAYEEDEAGTIEVEAWTKGSDVVYSIRDSGTPLAQRPVGSSGAGLGLYLIGSLSDDCELRNPEQGGTEILIGFRLKGEDRLRLIRKVLPEGR